MLLGSLVPFHPFFQHNTKHEDEKTPPKASFQPRGPRLLSRRMLPGETSAEGSGLGAPGPVPEVFSPPSPAVLQCRTAGLASEAACFSAAESRVCVCATTLLRRGRLFFGGMGLAVLLLSACHPALWSQVPLSLPPHFLFLFNK